MAGAVPHSTPVLTDGVLNLGKSTLDVKVTGTATFVMFLSYSLDNKVKSRLQTN